MEIEDVLKLERHGMPETICGIYFLFLEDNIVYIGQSINIIARVLTHQNQGVKAFDSYSFIECCRKDLDKTEAALICKFDPEYNATIPPGHGFMSLHQWTQYRQMKSAHVRKYIQKTSCLPDKKWYSLAEIDALAAQMDLHFGKRWRKDSKRANIELFLLSQESSEIAASVSELEAATQIAPYPYHTQPVVQ